MTPAAAFRKKSSAGGGSRPEFPLQGSESLESEHLALGSTCTGGRLWKPPAGLKTRPPLLAPGGLVLLRGIGPSLSDFGIANPLADPMLELRDGDGDLIGSNDN